MSTSTARQRRAAGKRTREHGGMAHVRDLHDVRTDGEDGSERKEANGTGKDKKELSDTMTFAHRLVNKMQARIAMEKPHAYKRKRVCFEENNAYPNHSPNHHPTHEKTRKEFELAPLHPAVVEGTHPELGQRWKWLTTLRRDSVGRPPTDPKYDPNTLLIPPEAWESLKEFDRQFWRIKCQRMDLVLFVRCGSFYNLFDIDADVGARVGLNACGKPKPNMWKVGCTATSFTSWANKILALGYAIGRVEETNNEDPKIRLLDRTLVAVYTPGIATEDVCFTPSPTCEAKSVLCVAEKGGGLIGMCKLDSYTGQISTTQLEDGPERRFLSTALACENPVEVIHVRGNVNVRTARTMQEYKRISEFSKAVQIGLPKESFSKAQSKLCELKELMPENLETRPILGDAKSLAAHVSLLETRQSWAALDALIVLIAHLERCLCTDRILSVAEFIFEDWYKGRSNHMLLDSSAIHNLNLLEGMAGTRDGSLVHRIDKTVTPAGRRMLLRWVCSPLQDASAIQHRYDALEVFCAHPNQTGCFQKEVVGLPDGERMLGALGSTSTFLSHHCKLEGSFDATQLSSKVVSLLIAVEGEASAVKHLVDSLALPRSKLPVLLDEAFTAANQALASLDDVHKLVAFERSQEDGNLKPRSRASPSYDRATEELKRLLGHLEEALAGLRHALSRKYFSVEGKPLPPKLMQSVKYVNTVLHGAEHVEHLYQLAVPSKLVSYVPDEWIEVRKIAGSTFYKVPSIGNLLTALVEEEEMRATAYSNFLQTVVAKIIASRDYWSSVFHAVAMIDVLTGFAKACTMANLPAHCKFCRPSIMDDCQSKQQQVHIKQGWHPLLKETKNIVCNDVNLGGEHPLGMILFGANSGGKSTLLRQVALSVILAQIGCFVPASQMTLTLVDRVFTRIGANDSIMSGHSTFALEMEETSIILQHASSNSLAILDELGRGTSTRDGYALAFAVLDYLSSRKPCMLLFASHFHELAKEKFLQSLSVCHMRSSTDESGRFVSEYVVSMGSSPKESCGILVAGVAGIPSSVLRSATIQAECYKREKTSSRHVPHGSNCGMQSGSGPPLLSAQEERLFERLQSTGIFSGRRVFSEAWCVQFWQLWLDARSYYRSRSC